MAYFGSTQLSSVANPPRQLIGAMGVQPAQAGSTQFLTTQGSSATNTPYGAVGGGGANLWYYSSTNLTTDLTGANFFTDGFYLGMKAGDAVMGVQFTSAGSSGVTFLGTVTSVTTAGCALSTGSLMTSTFN